MCCKKGHGWFWYAFCTLLAILVIYLIARMFKKSVEKEPKHYVLKPKKTKAEGSEALFI